MLQSDDAAPTFTAPRGTSEHESVSLDAYLGDRPVALASFPGPFPPPPSPPVDGPPLGCAVVAA